MRANTIQLNKKISSDTEVTIHTFFHKKLVFKKLALGRPNRPISSCINLT